MRPVVLTIAGSDPSAGAGIQADLKAIEANAAYAATAITAVTVQSTRGVSRTLVLDAELVRQQILAVLDDLPVRAAKTGMLPDAAVVGAVADLLEQEPELPYVLDPVLAAGGGFPLQSPEAQRPLLERLVPRATLVMPNAVEAQRLTGVEVSDLRGARAAGERLLGLGARAVLVKGGHLDRDRGSDLLITPEGCRVYSGAWIETPHTHGTGCVYSATIAALLAHCTPLEQAVARARTFLEQAIRHALPLGRGSGPTDPLFALHAGVGEAS